MEQESQDQAKLFPSIAAQLRNTLSTLQLAAAQLAPAAAREQDPELDAKAALLDQSCYRLLRLAVNLTDASLLTDGQPLPLKDADVVALVEELCLRAEPLAAELGLTLRFSSPMEQHICAVSPHHLEQLVYQLLSNAFKFTPAGGTVTVEVRRGGGFLRLSVADTGCGMTEDKL